MFVYTASVDLSMDDTANQRELVADATIAGLRVLFQDSTLYATGTKAQLEDWAINMLNASSVLLVLNTSRSAQGLPSCHPPLMHDMGFGGHAYLYF